MFVCVCTCVCAGFELNEQISNLRTGTKLRVRLLFEQYQQWDFELYFKVMNYHLLSLNQSQGLPRKQQLRCLMIIRDDQR